MILNEKDRILRRKSIELKKVNNLKGLRVDTSVPHGRERAEGWRSRGRGEVDLLL